LIERALILFEEMPHSRRCLILFEEMKATGWIAEARVALAAASPV
jgi:hypothetical protein